MTDHEERRPPTAFEIDGLLAAVGQERAPERDLWPAIAERLDESLDESPVSRTRRWPLGIAAVVSMAAAIGWFVLGGSPDTPPPTLTTTPAPLAEPVQPVSMPLPVLASFPGETYAVDRQREIDALEAQLDALPPGQREIIEINLDAIRTAIDEIDAALEKNPDSDVLAALLVRTYQQELETITTVNAITARGRNDL